MNTYSTEEALFPADALFCFQHQAVSLFCQYYIRVSIRKTNTFLKVVCFCRFCLNKNNSNSLLAKQSNTVKMQRIQILIEFTVLRGI